MTSMRKLLVVVGLLSVVTGGVLAQGEPVTLLREAMSSGVSLPWLAYWSDAADCQYPEILLGDEDNTGGCYSVPGVPADEILWDLTKAIRASGRWNQFFETHTNEPLPGSLIQMWQDALIPRRFLMMQYLLHESAEHRFYVQVSNLPDE